MAQAIILGLLQNSPESKSRLLATTRSPESADAFTALTDIPCSNDNIAACNDADVLVIGVKPQMIAGLADKISLHTKGKLIISIAAGVRIDTLKKAFDSDQVIRVMPNTPLTVGLGASAYSSSEAVSTDQELLCRQIFEAAGIIHKVEEKDIDAVTAVSGSGPAYIFELIRCMALRGTNLRLDENTALDLASQTVAGAAAMVQAGIASPETLRNNVTSPNGTTFAALEQMKADGFEDLVKRFITKAYDRSIELGQA